LPDEVNRGDRVPETGTAGFCDFAAVAGARFSARCCAAASTGAIAGPNPCLSGTDWSGRPDREIPTGSGWRRGAGTVTVTGALFPFRFSAGMAWRSLSIFEKSSGSDSDFGSEKEEALRSATDRDKAGRSCCGLASCVGANGTAVSGAFREAV
jgi:hypothetical protein